ncbi:tetratricopeptide repeat protein [Virgibacillus ndiopensis]|uniref:tetratricopeptide repeat protein n=1 Tax=Virgibacillus ndiopensis TaxID=2004408 RepID=UPI000C074857|nr:tetratricopeptide repeat protein [Virgibacillus ndiopensis]
MQKNGNVILFPKWQTTLEEESLSALKQKKYGEALEKLNKLLSYQINNHEIIIGKLICLMELEQYDEAQDLCEDVQKQKDEHYFQYVHIYLTILFQTSQYKLLMDQVEYEFETNEVPMPVKEQFQQLYDMSVQMNDQLNVEQSVSYIKELLDAVNEQNHSLQWRLVENMKKMKAKPDIQVMEDLLTNETVHPVTKTAIFQWLQEKMFSESVTIHKLNVRHTVFPTDITGLESHIFIKQTILVIGELEQKNPSLYRMIEKLLYRYAYVRYPFMPSNDDFMLIAEALISIGEEYLNLHNSEVQSKEVLQYIEEIKMCETLYLSIIED